MPTSSQAMIVLTEEGSDPRIPRRHYQTNKNLFFTNIGDSDTSQATRLPVLHTATSTSFQNVINIKNVHGTITYDAEPQRLCFLEPSTSHPACSFPDYRSLDFQQKQHELPNQYNRSSPVIVNNSEHQERQRIRHESLGFRKRRLIVPDAAERKALSGTTIPAAAKFMPTPPGQKPRQLPDLVPNTVKSNISGDSIVKVPLAESFVPNVPTVKPKSLLEELKEAVSYEKRLFPALHMRSTLPPPSPNSACFSLRKNDEYSHADVLQLLREKTGSKPRTIRYDPVDVRAGNSEICSRWVVEFANPDDAKTFLQNGLEVDGEKIIVKSLDEVHKMEYQAYRLKLEEERRLAERQAMSYAARKTRRGRAKSKHGRV